MSHFVRIPPDSTGKRIRHDAITEVVFTNSTSLLDIIDRYEMVIGAISGVTGRYISYEIEHEESYIYLDDVNGTFTQGETLLYNSQPLCQVTSQIEMYTQKNQIIDRYNPEHSLTIDKYGSAYTRYREGEQLFDSFGNAQTSVSYKIADFVFTYTSHDDEFYTESSGGGYMTHSSIQSINKLIVDSSSGSYIFRESIVNYPYVPGHGTFISVSLSCGDSGKEGLVRRWGLYDSDDGCYFELNGMTFSVNIRSSTTGTYSVDKVTPELFNGTLDYDINLDKFNLYWIDYQWQGVGRTRFGIFRPDGSRLVLHTFEHANSIVVPYMRRGTLPFRFEMINTTTTTSSSELKVTCVSISRQGGAPGLLSSGSDYNYMTTEKQIGSSYVPLLSVKPKVYFNGVTNRIVAVPSEIQIYTTEPIILNSIAMGTLSGDNFNVDLGSSIILDESASSISGGISLDTTFYDKGINSSNLQETLKYTLALYPNLYQPEVSFCAKTLNGLTASTTMIIKWREIY